jgi:thymidylate synthase (FAD)
MKIVTPEVHLLWITQEPIKTIERTARVCYRSEDKIVEGSAETFVKGIVDRGHHAMIEHAVASLHFICDRGVTHEIVRHRLASYAQESTRYCNYSKEKFGKQISVIKPPQLTEEAEKIWSETCEMIDQNYQKLVTDLKIPAQIARSILPNCLKTEIIVTANFREWFHMFTLRTSPKAHPQMREVMIMALDILKKEAPTIFSDIVVE